MAGRGRERAPLVLVEEIQKLSLERDGSAEGERGHPGRAGGAGPAWGQSSANGKH